MLSVDALADAVRSPSLRRGLATALLTGQAATSVAAAPDFLVYFNPLTGGPDVAWRQLADSNIDWGQDLPALAELIERRGVRAPLLDYFGTASPAEYGVLAASLNALPGRTEDHDVLAVSVTHLQSVYAPRTTDGRRLDVYRSLRQLPPSDRAGRSILIYDLHDPSVRQALAEALAINGSAECQAAMGDSEAARR